MTIGWKGTRYDWLRNPGMDPDDRRAFDALRNGELKTARAWALKKDRHEPVYLHLPRPGAEALPVVVRLAARSRLTPMKEVAAMLKRRFANIITYLKHRITNATSESINAKIQWVKYTARGFRKQTELH